MKIVSLNPNFIIKQLRLGHYLSQQDIANVLGVSQQKYNCYERDNYNVNVQKLARIAQFYNVSLDCISGTFMEYKPFNPEIEPHETEAVKYFEENKTNLVLKYGRPNARTVFENIPFTEEV